MEAAFCVPGGLVPSGDQEEKGTRQSGADWNSWILSFRLLGEVARSLWCQALKETKMRMTNLGQPDGFACRNDIMYIICYSDT